VEEQLASASLLLAAALCCATVPPAVAADVRVDLELVLAVDDSPSIDVSQYFLQRGGYVAAFRDERLVDVIRSGHYGRIVVAYVEWAGWNRQRIIMPWTLIDGAESASRFAATLETARTKSSLGTSLSGALAFAEALFADNGFDGKRRVIDVSGNGRNNVGPPVLPVRDAVLAAGVTINGLPIMSDPTEIGLESYYRYCVIGGAGAFLLKVEKREDFATAIRRKLVAEIAARPMPESAAVLGVADTIDAGCD
jgi:hypothetical protein